MVIDAEFEEIEVTDQELDLTAEDSLPWLEADEEDAGAGGIDSVQVMSLLAILLLLGAIIIGAVWYFTGRSDTPDLVPDGSTIEAPDGPIKERPEDRGGKEFEGTGNIAPAIGEGEARDGQLGDGSGAGSGSGAVAAGGDADATNEDAPRPSIDTQSAEPAASSTSGGVAVQLAAYGNRERAEKGWADLSRSSSALNGVSYRIVEAKVDIGTVYRLQAMASNSAEADALCSAIKAEGLECAVKP